MSAFRLPKQPDLVAIPSVLTLVYLTTTSTTSPFIDIRARLPLWLTDYAVPVLFYVHVLEALLAGFRSVQAGRPASETLKWVASTMIWGFASLGQQKRALVLKR